MRDRLKDIDFFPATAAGNALVIGDRTYPSKKSPANTDGYGSFAYEIGSQSLLVMVTKASSDDRRVIFDPLIP